MYVNGDARTKVTPSVTRSIHSRMGDPTGHLLGDLWQDLRYATRTFWKKPAFASATVLTLALGIGATAAIFSVVHGVLLKPLPFQEPERLVSLRQHAPHGAGTNHGPATYFTYRENQKAFEAIGVWDSAEVSITGGGNPERVQALLVSAATLPLLRVQPVLGRAFGAEDDTPGTPSRVLLTYGYWQRRFGGAESIVGQSLAIDGAPVEVIGVLPSSFKFLSTRPDVVLPMPLDANAPRGISFGFQALARLKPGVTLAQANADVARLISLLPPIFARLELQPNVRPLADDVIGNVGEILWILLAAVGVVLLIACGNVANLYLVRAEGRQQEFAMRGALGASRGRIARALLSESVVLALAGGAVGVALAQAATGLLRRIAPAELPRVDDIGIDGRVLLFTVSVSLLSGVLFGLIAVLRFGTPSMAALKEGGRSAGDAPGRHRTRNVLVVGQVALALTLLIASGLMIRTFIAMRQVDPGFTRPEEVQTFVLAIPEGLISDPQETARVFERVAERLVKSQASGPLVSRRPSRWTARTTATRSSGKAHRCRKAKGAGSGGSRVSRRAISRRWATVWSRGAPSRGARSTSNGRSSSFRKRSPGSIGKILRRRLAGVCVPACSRRGGRSWAWSVTSATMGCTGHRRRSCTGRC